MEPPSAVATAIYHLQYLPILLHDKEKHTQAFTDVPCEAEENIDGAIPGSKMLPRSGKGMDPGKGLMGDACAERLFCPQTGL